MKRSLCILFIALTFIISVFANGDEENQSAAADSDKGTDIKFVMNIQHNNSETISWQKSFEFIQSEMQKKYPKMDSKIFPNGQLAKGDWKIIIEQLQAGTIQIACESQGSWATLVPELFVLSTPFLFEDPEHLIRFMSDENRPDIVDEWFVKLEEKGLVYLGYWPRGSRQLLSKVGPIITPDDIKDVKFRVMGLDIFIDIFEAFGAKPIPLPYGELYTALQLGTVQGEDNALSTVHTFKQYEQAKYFNVWNYIADGVVIVANKDWYDSLPMLVQDDLLEIVNRSVQVEYDQLIVQEKEARIAMEKEGVIFTDFNADMKEPWKNRLDAVYDGMRDMIGLENWEEIIRIADKTR